MTSTAKASSSGPVRPNAVTPSLNNIIVNPTQRGNPILEHIRNVGKEFGEIVVDYQVGRTTGVLFLSLKYHRLHPEYVHQRIERLGHSYNLRILLMMCDISEHQEPIRELTKVCLINNITVVVAWSAEEAGHYLATFKQFEHRPPDMIKERIDQDYPSVLRAALTSISKVNKTDVETLRTSFGSFAKIATATSDQLTALPGFGQVKVRRIKDAFERPFRTAATSSLTALDKLPSQRLLAAASDADEVDAWAAADPAPAARKDKGKGKERVAPEPEPELAPAPRAESPPWDMDDFPSPGNDAPSSPILPPPVPRTAPPAPLAMVGAAREKRPPSPVWDLELDLNPSDEEMDVEPARKRPRNSGDLD